jgi:hypothetical protein
VFSSSAPGPAADGHVLIGGVPEGAGAVPLVSRLASFFLETFGPSFVCSFVYKARMFLSGASRASTYSWSPSLCFAIASSRHSDHLTKLVLCLPQCGGNRIVHWIRKVQLADGSDSVEYTSDCSKCSTHIALEELMMFQAILCSPIKILHNDLWPRRCANTDPMPIFHRVIPRLCRFSTRRNLRRVG